MKTGLQACPFCGSDKIITDALRGCKRTLFRAQCETCNGGTGWKQTGQDAAAAWGIRAEGAAVLRRPSPYAWRTAVYP
jgi:hypothetical protein